jgi:hypothetical protein
MCKLGYEYLADSATNRHTDNISEQAFDKTFTKKKKVSSQGHYIVNAAKFNISPVTPA